jgi:hypothetical protein
MRGFALLFALLPACQDYDFVFRPNQRIAITTVREVVVANTDTDILFVVDNSGSMKEEQENLRDNTEAFINELALSENAYRVGIITTDVFASSDAGRLRMTRASQATLNSRCNGVAADTSGKLWLERPNADPTSQQFADESCRLVEDFKATINNLEPIDHNGDGCFAFDQDTIGDGREAGLRAAALAVSDEDAIRFNRHGNEDFLREAADLALIFLTDESDCSFETYSADSTNNNSWCYEEIANAVPVEDYVTLFGRAKQSAAVRKVRAALIGGGVFVGADVLEFVPKGCRVDTTANAASADCGCWSSTRSTFFCELLHDLGHPCPTGNSCLATGTCNNTFLSCSADGGTDCDTDRCEAMPALRYHAFIESLGDERVDVGFPRGTFEDSICQPDYDETLKEIARTVVLSSCFPLEEEVLNPDQVKMQVRHVDTDGEVSERLVPNMADCTGCTGECSNGAWRMQSSTEICLECDLKKEPGTNFVLTVVNEIVGFDGGGGDP